MQDHQDKQLTNQQVQHLQNYQLFQEFQQFQQFQLFQEFLQFQLFQEFQQFQLLQQNQQFMLPPKKNFSPQNQQNQTQNQQDHKVQQMHEQQSDEVQHQPNHEVQHQKKEQNHHLFRRWCQTTRNHGLPKLRICLPIAAAALVACGTSTIPISPKIQGLSQVQQLVINLAVMFYVSVTNAATWDAWAIPRAVTRFLAYWAFWRKSFAICCSF